MADKKAGAALAISIPAVIAAAAALKKRTQAAPPESELVIPQELIDLVVAIAELDQQILEALQKLSIDVQGWPENANGITAMRVQIPVTGVRMPFTAVPSGMNLVIRAWPGNPVGSMLQVSGSQGECVNPNQSYPLQPGEVVAYQVENAQQIYIGATVAGCTAVLTVEQRK